MATIKKNTESAGEDMEKREPSYSVGGNLNSCSHFAKQYGGFLKKLKLQLPYNPAIPILGIYPAKPQNSNSKKHMHPNVHSSIIYNCQDMETAQLSVNG